MALQYDRLTGCSDPVPLPPCASGIEKSGMHRTQTLSPCVGGNRPSGKAGSVNL